QAPPESRQSATRAARPSSRSAREMQESRSRTRLPLEREYTPAQPVMPQPAPQANAGMPPWVYAAAGAGGVITLAFMIFVLRSLITETSLPAKPERAASEPAAKADLPPVRVAAEPTPAETQTQAPARENPIMTAEQPPPRPVPILA